MRRQELAPAWTASETAALIAEVRRMALPLQSDADLDPLLEQIGDAHYVLLGEASHGTAEYYRWRTRLTNRLLAEKNFSFVAVEGDWPDCYRVHQYIQGEPAAGGSAREVLQVFTRWPTWMWANEEILELVDWLHACNAVRQPEQRLGFYGLDVYSLWDSLYALMSYVQRSAPEAAAAVRRTLRCFEPYEEDPQEYAQATAIMSKSCAEEALQLLVALRRQAAAPRTSTERDAHFVAEQNALVVKNAEAYYRAMMHADAESWNIRDRHMVETLERLMQHHGPGTRAIVWEHNTHIGDARYTDMAAEGMVNVGQLVREQHEREGVVLVGFGSHRGSVIAGEHWGAPWQRMTVPPAREGSWEDILHRCGAADKLLLLAGTPPDSPLLHWRAHRAIGVVYNPQYEHYGNYVPTVLPRRYDAFLYLDETEALQPLPGQEIERNKLPETYPSGV